jgi:hypothetical protein
MQRHQLQPPHLRSNQDSETCSPLGPLTLAHEEHAESIVWLSLGNGRRKHGGQSLEKERNDLHT